jgi:hypothetical protein
MSYNTRRRLLFRMGEGVVILHPSNEQILVVPRRCPKGAEVFLVMRFLNLLFWCHRV